jgi:hypothetical protein
MDSLFRQALTEARFQVNIAEFFLINELADHVSLAVICGIQIGGVDPVFYPFL